MKFKIGDRVMVLTDNACSARVRAGDVGTIVNISNALHCKMDVYRGGAGSRTWFFNENVVEHYLYDEATEAIKSMRRTLEEIKI